jgi:hypothetical protein
MPGGPPQHVGPRRRRVSFASPSIVEFRALRTLMSVLLVLLQKRKCDQQNITLSVRSVPPTSSMTTTSRKVSGGHPTSMPAAGHLSLLCALLSCSDQTRSRSVQISPDQLGGQFDGSRTWACTQLDSVQSPGRLQGAGSSQSSVPCCRKGSAGGTRAHACLLAPGLTAPVEAAQA